MFTTAPKGKKPGTSVKPKAEELSSPYRARATITDSEENRARQVYGNNYSKQATPERPEFKGVMKSPHSTMIGIG